MTTKNFVVKNGLTTGNINLYAGNSNISASFVVADLSVPSSANLGIVGNIYIGGGTNGQVLSTNGSGSLSWIDQSGGGNVTQTTIAVDNFTGDGTTVTYTLSVTPTSINSVFVNYNGAFIGRGSYSLSGANLTFGSAPANNSSIEVTTVQGLTIGSGSFTTRTATGDGSTANYTVSSGTTVSSVLVALDGVVQVPTTDYTISGSTLTFTTPPSNTVEIQIRELSVASSSGGTPGGSNTQVQFNDSSSFGGSAGFTFDKTTTTLTANNFIATSTANLGSNANITITGGTNGQVLTTNGSGALSWSAGGPSNVSIRAQAMTMGILLGG